MIDRTPAASPTSSLSPLSDSDPDEPRTQEFALRALPSARRSAVRSDRSRSAFMARVHALSDQGLVRFLPQLEAINSFPEDLQGVVYHRLDQIAADGEHAECPEVETCVLKIVLALCRAERDNAA